MNERYQRVLEYPKILNRLAGLAVSAMGKERALALRPSGDFDEVRRLQAQTEEASSVIAYTGGNPMSEFDDVREYLKLSTVGATLSMKALLSVAGALRACRTVRKALVTEREDTPILTEMGSRIASNRMLEEDITNAIISEDEMSDHASPELYDIRRHIRVINDRVRDKLNSYIRSASTQKYLMDSIITMRNDRYVVPVKAECRQFVPGLVHDQSGSGSTLFMVGITTSLGRVLTLKQIPSRLCTMLTSVSDSPIVILGLITILLLIVGCFMDNISATIILAPMLLPTVLECGLSTVQFGVVMTMLLAIGFITPPYGINLFVASQISHEPLMKIAKKAVPLMLSMLIAAIFTMAWSGLTDGIVHLFT